MSLPGVVGTAEGECYGRPCILVLVERLTPALRQAITPELSDRHRNGEAVASASS
jgi:hypothetical protein